MGVGIHQLGNTEDIGSFLQHKLTTMLDRMCDFPQESQSRNPIWSVFSDHCDETNYAMIILSSVTHAGRKCTRQLRDLDQRDNHSALLPECDKIACAIVMVGHGLLYSCTVPVITPHCAVCVCNKPQPHLTAVRPSH